MATGHDRERRVRPDRAADWGFDGAPAARPPRRPPAPRVLTDEELAEQERLARRAEAERRARRAATDRGRQPRPERDTALRISDERVRDRRVSGPAGPPPADPQTARRRPSEPRRPPETRRAPEPRRAPDARRPEPRRRPEPSLEFQPRRSGLPRRQQILLPLIALLTVIAVAVGAIALSTQPKTGQLQGEIQTLQGRLATAEQQLGTLRGEVAKAPTGNAFQRLVHSVNGLKRTVGGLQNSDVPLQAKVNSLAVCMPQLQTELSGASYTQTKGRKATVFTAPGLSPGCASMLNGG